MAEPFKLELPTTEEIGPEERNTVVPFPGTQPPTSDPEAAAPSADIVPADPKPSLLDRVVLLGGQVSEVWSSAWVGDGLLGHRPRPVADLIRQFITEPPPYIRDALILRIPYALYGAPVITTSAAAHLLLFIVSYPSVFAGVATLITILVLTT